jgi:uncharacterized protein YneF (UPF0154 family)
MLVDVIKRDLENKTQWLLVVILLNWFGAILYFFIARKEAINREIKENMHAKT